MGTAPNLTKWRRGSPGAATVIPQGSRHADVSKLRLESLGPAFAFVSAALTANAAKAGEHLEDSWAVAEFENGRYELRVYGPNEFFRAFAGGTDDPPVRIHFGYARNPAGNPDPSGSIEIQMANDDERSSHSVEIRDGAYGAKEATRIVPAGKNATLTLKTERSFGWYDLHVSVATTRLYKRYAGRIEIGNWNFSDPFMGGVSNFSDRPT
jgi:phospholipase C